VFLRFFEFWQALKLAQMFSEKVNRTTVLCIRMQQIKHESAGLASHYIPTCGACIRIQAMARPEDAGTRGLR
jgi:hypothetical protein